MHDKRIDTFLATVATHDGVPPLSEAKLDSLREGMGTVLIEEHDEVVAVGVTAKHLQPDGSDHWAVETVLGPGLRFNAFENQLLQSSLELVPANASFSVWSHRHSLDGALKAAGFSAVRELGYLVVELPISSTEATLTTRPYRSLDAAGVVSLNRAAFATHREAAALDESELEHLMQLPGFGSSGFRIAEIDESIVGFCWTRTHASGDGEIFRIAVSPDHLGGGLGRSLLLAGFDHLSRQEDVSRGSLWVDLSNKPAVSLYESVGMLTERVNREFERSEG